MQACVRALRGCAMRGASGASYPNTRAFASTLGGHSDYKHETNVGNQEPRMRDTGSTSAVPSRPESVTAEAQGIPILATLVNKWRTKAPVAVEVEALQLPEPWDPTRTGFAIHNVLTPTECAELVAATEALGYAQALVNLGGGRQTLMSDYRASDRIMIDSHELADYVWERISEHVTPHLRNKETMVAKELNERLRFLRYDPGGCFRQHRDAKYARSDGKDKSYLTLLLYLNDGYDGCWTRLYSDGRTVDGSRATSHLDFPPQPGSVLIHDHSVLHEATTLRSGRKYVIRTDIMYTNRSAEDTETAA